MKKYVLAMIISMISVILVACGGSGNDKPESEKPSIEITEEEKAAEDEVVAIIDGEEIDGAFYNEVYLQQKAITVDVLGDNYDLDEVKTGTIESIVNDYLILHMGAEEGIVVTEEEVDEEVKELKKIGTEGYNTLKEQFNYTDEAIEHLLRVEFTLKQYIDKHVEVEVSDAEIEAYYEEISGGDEELPTLEEAWEELEDVIRIEKSKDEARKHIAEYKKTVEIDINI